MGIEWLGLGDVRSVFGAAARLALKAPAALSLHLPLVVFSCVAAFAARHGAIVSWSREPSSSRSGTKYGLTKGRNGHTPHGRRMRTIVTPER